MSSVAEEITTTQAAILVRAILPGEPLTPAMARFLADLHFRESDVARMNELAAKARADALTVEERRELDDFMRAGDVLETIKLNARRTLSSGNGST